MARNKYQVFQHIKTPHGKAEIVEINTDEKWIKVKHLESLTSITCYNMNLISPLV